MIIDLKNVEIVPEKTFRVIDFEAVLPDLVLQDGKFINSHVGYLPTELPEHRRFYPEYRKWDDGILTVEVSDEVIEFDEEIVYIPFSKYYGNWLFGDLPRLGYIEDLTKRKVIHFPESFTNFDLDIKFQKIPHRARIKAPSAICVYPTYLHHCFDAKAIRAMRDYIMPEPSWHDGLYYFSRKYINDSRPITNEEEIEQLMESLGFAVVYPEKLGFKEQVRLASTAKCIAGPHGAALGNMIFAPTGCSIYCIATKYSSDILDLAAILGHKFYLDMESVSINHSDGTIKFNADIEKLKTNLKRNLQ